MFERANPEQIVTPFQLENCDNLTAFREALRAADYSQASLLKTIEEDDPTCVSDTALVLRRTASPSPYHVLVRLFVLGKHVADSEVRLALNSPILDQLIRVGLLERQGEALRSVAALVPFQDLYVASDFSFNVTGRSLMTDHVMGVASSSLCLASLTPRRESESALDLGTGSGFQALLLARHTAHVTSTDSSRRALNFAGFNARLNGISNIRIIEGNLYEPVTECRFDLIVSNPPFMVSPEQKYLFRDSALPGDSISENIIRGAAERLRDGGFGVIVFNWLQTNPQDMAERPRKWVQSSGCDALMLHFETLDPLSYAAKSLRATEGHDSAEYARQIDERLSYYEHVGIQGIHAGVIILRRRKGQVNWIQTESVKPESTGSCSKQIEHIFNAQDFLQGLGDISQLLDQSLVIAPEHQLDIGLHAHEGTWRTRYARLKQTEGLEFTSEVDQYVSSMLAKCDGKHPLRMLVEETAKKMDIGFEELAPDCLNVVRMLMQSGYFVIAKQA